MVLRQRVETSQIEAREKADLAAELDLKIEQFQQALADALGLDLQAYTTRSTGAPERGPFGGGIDETSRSVSPGDPLEVRIHTGNATKEAKLERVWLRSSDGSTRSSESWSSEPDGQVSRQPDVSPLSHTSPAKEAPTQLSATRPSQRPAPL